MSRFLQRLAEHAMGVSRPARSISAAPYASAPLLSEETADIGVQANAPEQPLMPTMARAAPQARERTANSMPENTALASQAASSGGMSPAPPQAGDASAPEILVPQATDARSPLMPVQGDTRPRLADRETAPSDAHDIPTSVPAPERELPRRAPAESFPETGGAIRSAMTVAPLLPTTRQTRTIAPERRIDGAVRPTASAVEESTEIHVSIGRIEIAAPPQTPATPKTAASRRRAPMSLDEYLSKRQGGRP